MLKKFRAGIIFFLIVGSTCAQAAPALRSYWSDSHFFIDATNDEDRAYNCQYTFSWSDEDHGKRNPIHTESGSFFVKANWKGNVMKKEGVYVNPKTEAKPNFQCN